MANVYLLAHRDAAGAELMLGAFDTEAKLVEYLREHLTLKLDGMNVNLKLDKEYVVRLMPLNTVGLYPDPKFKVTQTISVRSDTDYNTLYKVSVDGKTVFACTCKSYEFSGGDACKHMRRVVASPGTYDYRLSFGELKLA